MAVKIIDECCNCASPGFPCIGNRCELRHVPHLICDRCEEDVDRLYWYEGEQLCRDCILESLEVVDYDF